MLIYEQLKITDSNKEKVQLLISLIVRANVSVYGCWSPCGPLPPSVQYGGLFILFIHNPNPNLVYRMRTTGIRY